MHKETWLTRRSNTGSPQFTDLQSHCLCSESSLTNLIARVIVWQYETFSCPKAALSTKNHDLWEQPFWNTKELSEFCPSGFTAQSASFAHAWNGCSQSLSFSDRWSRGTKTLRTRLSTKWILCACSENRTRAEVAHILVPRASVSFGHVVCETEGSGSSNYRMSENHGHPVTHAYYLSTYLLMLRN